MLNWGFGTNNGTAQEALLRLQELGSRLDDEFEQASELEDFSENLSVGLQSVNRDGKLVWANHRMLEILGYTKDQYIGVDLHELIEDSELLDTILRSLSSGEESHGSHVRIRHSDGGWREFEVHSNGCFKLGEFNRSRCVMIEKHVADHLPVR